MGDELEETLNYAASADYKFVELQWLPGNLFASLVNKGADGIRRIVEMLKNGGLIAVAVYLHAV